MKEKYIEALPYIVLDDVYRVKSELDIAKEKNSQLENENIVLKEELSKVDEIMERLSKLEEEN